MTAMTAERQGTGWRWPNDLGTSLKDAFWPRRAAKLLDSTEGIPRRPEYAWGSDESDMEAVKRAIFDGLMAVDASHFDLLSDLSSYLIEATGAVDPALLAALNRMAAVVEKTRDHALLDDALPLFALSVEPVRLTLTFVEPHFNWSDELEIDPLDDLE